MPRTRAPKKLFLATAAASLAALGAPTALADEPEPRLAASTGVDPIARWLGDLKLPKPDPGPFAPIVGKPDLGTADNAFGAARSGHVHAGQDMFAPVGTPLVAVSDSVVADVGSDGGQGNYVHLYDSKHDRTYVYMHMVAPAIVKQGEQVRAGARVGGVGCTGSCWGNHLHFEVREGRGFEGEATDPMPYLREWESLERPRS